MLLKFVYFLGFDEMADDWPGFLALIYIKKLLRGIGTCERIYSILRRYDRRSFPKIEFLIFSETPFDALSVLR